MEKPSMNPKPIERKKSNNKKIASTGCPSKFGGAEIKVVNGVNGPNLPGHPVKKVLLTFQARLFSNRKVFENSLKKSHFNFRAINKYLKNLKVQFLAIFGAKYLKNWRCNTTHKWLYRTHIRHKHRPKRKKVNIQVRGDIFWWFSNTVNFAHCAFWAMLSVCLLMLRVVSLQKVATLRKKKKTKESLPPKN